MDWRRIDVRRGTTSKIIVKTLCYRPNIFADRAFAFICFFVSIKNQFSLYVTVIIGWGKNVDLFLFRIEFYFWPEVISISVPFSNGVLITINTGLRVSDHRSFFYGLCVDRCNYIWKRVLCAKAITNNNSCFSAGNKDLNVPPIDPLFLEKFSIVQNQNSPVNIQLHFRNLTLNGIKDLVIYKVV